jgi:hypothetical protein
MHYVLTGKGEAVHASGARGLSRSSAAELERDEAGDAIRLPRGEASHTFLTCDSSFCKRCSAVVRALLHVYKTIA